MHDKQDEAERATIRRVSRRVLPLCFALYIISYIDRANIGYAALQMNAELGLTSEAFGFAAGIFFVGYFLCEVPSNIALLKFGPRRWISRILITWGTVSVATAFVQTQWQLYVMRFFLGVAEAGFFPAIVIYLTAWFRTKEQATALSLFTAAIPVSYVIGAPMSTFIMDHVSWLGLSGWRSMLLVEGAPALVGGIATYFILVDRPSEARWLTVQQSHWLENEIEKDHHATSERRHLTIWKAVSEPRVLFLSLIYFVYQTGSLGVGYWMPQVLKASSEASNFQVGLLATLPYFVATVGMILWSRRSDRIGERRMHAALPLLLAAIALIGIPLVHNLFGAIALLTLALTGFYAFKSPFWTLPGLFLSQPTAAVSIAAINSIGNLGGFVGPYMVGYVAKSSSPLVGLMLLGALTLVSFMATWRAPLGRQSEGINQQEVSNRALG